MLESYGFMLVCTQCFIYLLLLSKSCTLANTPDVAGAKLKVPLEKININCPKSNAVIAQR